MSFYLVSLDFVQPAVVLVNDSPKTKHFDKKPIMFLVVGEKEIRGKSHLCGFVSSIAGQHIIPTPKINEIKEKYDRLLSLDVDTRIDDLKTMLGIDDFKIQKDKIVDRTLNDGTEPIHMFNRSKPLWSK